tara:strand:- start:65 stop:340 length:276 start_codon:yes stop_codon:yes gene_type:complete
MTFRLSIISFFALLLAFGCSSDNTRCGDITDKEIVNGKYYFIMNADSNTFNPNSFSANNEIASYIPDNSVSGEVIESVYNSFSIGEEYCAE